MHASNSTRDLGSRQHVHYTPLKSPQDANTNEFLRSYPIRGHPAGNSRGILDLPNSAGISPITGSRTRTTDDARVKLELHRSPTQPYPKLPRCLTDLSHQRRKPNHGGRRQGKGREARCGEEARTPPRNHTGKLSIRRAPAKLTATSRVTLSSSSN